MRSHCLLDHMEPVNHFNLIAKDLAYSLTHLPALVLVGSLAWAPQLDKPGHTLRTLPLSPGQL